MAKGLYVGTLMFGIDQVLFRGKRPGRCITTPPTTKHWKPKTLRQPIAYPKPDGG